MCSAKSEIPSFVSILLRLTSFESKLANSNGEGRTILLGIVASAIGHDILMAVALIWIEHIGFDRLLGFGLKYSTGFKGTRLAVQNHK